MGISEMIWVQVTAGRHHGERGWYAEGFRDRELREGFVIVNSPDQDFPRDAARKRLCDVRRLDEEEARVAQGLPPPERPRMPLPAAVALPAGFTWEKIDGFR
jgi:hypothetical protein